MIEFRKIKKKEVSEWGWHEGYDYVDMRSEHWVDVWEFKTEFSDWREIKSGIFVPNKGFLNNESSK